MSKAYVDFKDLKTSEGLKIELVDIQVILNSSPSAKVGGQWVGNPLNIAIMNDVNRFLAEVKQMIKQGLMYSRGDYYIFMQFGNKFTIKKTPNGMIKALSTLANKKGYLVNINTGVIYKDHVCLKVTTDGTVDTLELENDFQYLAKQVSKDDIVAPYAVVTLFAIDTKKMLSRKVFIVRDNEYKNAVSQSKSRHTHDRYPTVMSEKIALKRGVEKTLAMFGDDNGEDYINVLKAINEHNEDYDMKKQPESTQKERIGNLFADTRIEERIKDEE